MPRHHIVRQTELGNLSEYDGEKCKKLVIDTLWNNAGNVWRAARSLGVSREFFWNVLRKHNLSKIPEEIREEYRKRYRVFPSD